jgi:antitoxin (DNA-binding transcriptional repressor) of toxin-antitoxin stability system
MKRIGLREANQQFARVIRTVRGGESVTLLDRDRPIAVIRPLPAQCSPVDRVVAEGLLIPASEPGLLPDWRPVRITGGLSRAVREGRRERA